MKLTYAEPLTHVAFLFTLRRYSAGNAGAWWAIDTASPDRLDTEVGRCSLTAYNPESEARLVS